MKEKKFSSKEVEGVELTDGSIYTGEVFDSVTQEKVPHGFGELITSDGQNFKKGKFENGKLIEGIVRFYDENGKIKETLKATRLKNLESSKLKGKEI